MLLTKRTIQQGESSKMNIKLWGDDFWSLRQSGRNKYNFNKEQITETQRIRKFLTPKEIATELGVGIFKVHHVINDNEIQIPIYMKKKGIHPISAKVQKKATKINARVNQNVISVCSTPSNSSHSSNDISESLSLNGKSTNL